MEQNDFILLAWKGPIVTPYKLQDASVSWLLHSKGKQHKFGSTQNEHFQNIFFEIFSLFHINYYRTIRYSPSPSPKIVQQRLNDTALESLSRLYIHLAL
jgi:hypothetical protein